MIIEATQRGGITFPRRRSFAVEVVAGEGRTTPSILAAAPLHRERHTGKLVPAVKTGLCGGTSLRGGITVVAGRRPFTPPFPRGQSYVVGGLYPTSEAKSASKSTLPEMKLVSSGSVMFGRCWA